MSAPEEAPRKPRRRWRRVLGVVGLVLVVAVAIGYYVIRGYLAGFVPAMVAGGEGQLFSVKVPEGFRITYFAEEVEGARSLASGPDGIVFVGSRGPGKVYALVDRDSDGVAEHTYVLDSDLDNPNGVAYRDGSLYVAEISRILRYDEIAAHLEDPPEPVVLRDDLPTETHHGWKFIAFGPDDHLYVPIGAPCNVCESEDRRFAAIHRMSPDGTTFERVVSGVRNTVGFDWHPETHELWFTDNGRDWLGDDSPPDELNRVRREGAHFGFPYCHGRDIADPEHSSKRCDEITPPEVELDPHGAALGMRFHTGDRFPERYRGGIFIAQHGSWNRSVPSGYRVLFVGLEEDGTPRAPEVFAEGWLHGSAAWGRPVDLVFLPDGSMLVSDDKEGAVYRIDYVDD